MEKKALAEVHDSQIKILDIIAILDMLHLDLKKSEEIGAYTSTSLRTYATTPNHKWRVLSQIAKEKLIEIYAQQEICLNDSQLMN